MLQVGSKFYYNFILLSVLSYVESWNILGWEVNSLNPFCYMQECCNADYINFRKNRLDRNLAENVFGQPFLEVAAKALFTHFKTNQPGPLFLSFHGSTGTGKSYVSDFIADSIYIKGTKSKFVQRFIGGMHFSQKSQLYNYQDFHLSLGPLLKQCPQTLFIFDEVEKMLPETISFIHNRVHSLIKHAPGAVHAKVVFIFLTNSDDFMSDKTREDLDTFIEKGAFIEEKRFWNWLWDSVKSFVGGTTTENKTLMDYHIPFLPITKTNVEKCVLKEFSNIGVNRPKREHIEQAMQTIEWIQTANSQKISKTGCKRLGQKVAALVDKFYRHTEL